MPATPPGKGAAERRAPGRLPDSTRTTVAPYSPKYLVVIGPTATQQKSRTFKPSNGFGVPSSCVIKSSLAVIGCCAGC